MTEPTPPPKPCAKCGAPEALNLWVRCRTAGYCGAVCQHVHWNYHKQHCGGKLHSEGSQGGVVPAVADGTVTVAGCINAAHQLQNVLEKTRDEPSGAENTAAIACAVEDNETWLRPEMLPLIDMLLNMLREIGQTRLAKCMNDQANRKAVNQALDGLMCKGVVELGGLEAIVTMSKALRKNLHTYRRMRILSVGSGLAVCEWVFAALLEHKGPLHCVDPATTSFCLTWLNPADHGRVTPMIKPTWNTLDDRPSTELPPDLLMLVWPPANSDDNAYDLDAVTRLKPPLVLFVGEVSGGAGSSKFLRFLQGCHGLEQAELSRDEFMGGAEASLEEKATAADYEVCAGAKVTKHNCSAELYDYEKAAINQCLQKGINPAELIVWLKRLRTFTYVWVLLRRTAAE
jgi:hypothetical protein